MRYYHKLTILLGLIWGFIAIQRIVIAIIMPAIQADRFSLYVPMWMAAISGLVIMVVSVFSVETAPKKVAKMIRKPTRDDHLLKPFRGKQPVTIIDLYVILRAPTSWGTLFCLCGTKTNFRAFLRKDQT